MSSGAVIARIISQYSDKGSKAAQKDIARTAKTIDAFNKKIVKSYAIAGAAVAAFGIKLAKDAVQGAMEDQKQQGISHCFEKYCWCNRCCHRSQC